MWVTDPKDGGKSVSLTLVCVFGLSALVANWLVVAGKVSSSASVNELFWGAIALYFGRRNLSFGGKSYSAGDPAEVKEKTE